MSPKVRHRTPTTSDPIAAIANAKSGDTVVIGAGVFASSQTIDIPDGVTVIGQGADATHLKGRIYFGSGGEIRKVKLGDAGYSIRNRNGAHDTVFDHVRLRGGGGSGGDAGTLLLGDWSRSVRDVLFVDTDIECALGAWNNVRITENSTDPAGAHVEGITFQRCHFGVHNGLRQGCPRMDFEAYCANLNNGATFYHGWRDLAIIDSIFEFSDWYNIDLACGISGVPGVTADGVRISGCTLKGAKRYTVCVESPTGVVIEDNVIQRGGTNTIKWGWGDMTGIWPRTIVRRNHIDLVTDNGGSCGSPAIYVKGGGNEVTGNTISLPASVKLFQLDQAPESVIGPNTVNGVVQ